MFWCEISSSESEWSVDIKPISYSHNCKEEITTSRQDNDGPFSPSSVNFSLFCLSSTSNQFTIICACTYFENTYSTRYILCWYIIYKHTLPLHFVYIYLRIFQYPGKFFIDFLSFSRHPIEISLIFQKKPSNYLSIQPLLRQRQYYTVS